MSQADGNAQSILEQVQRTYSTCSSYQDTGEIVTVVTRGPRPWERLTARKPFLTAFVRPSQFRFECREMTVGPESEWSHYVVWSDGRGFRCWNTLRAELESHESLNHAFVGPMAVSCGSAGAIPSLLMHELVFRHSLPEGSNIELTGKEEIDGSACFVLRCAPRKKGPSTWWIDVERFLILRSEETHTIDEDVNRRTAGKVRREPTLTPEHKAQLLVHFEGDELVGWRRETTTRYRPRIDVPIDAANWSFEPPS